MTTAVVLTAGAVIGIGGVAWKRHVQPQATVTSSKQATRGASAEGLSDIGGLPARGAIYTISPHRLERLEKPGASSAIGKSPLRRLENPEQPGASAAD